MRIVDQKCCSQASLISVDQKCGLEVLTKVSIASVGQKCRAEESIRSVAQQLRFVAQK